MIIYKATNIVNGKIYIGQTKNDIKKRIYEHKCRAFNPLKKKFYFHRSILKYGWDSFTWETLCVCHTIEETNNKESEYINIYQSNNSSFGYNLTKGGESNPMNEQHVIDKHQEAVIALSKDPDWIEAKRVGDEKQKSTYEITFPDGTVEIVTGLNQFCKDHQLQQSKMSSVASGNRIKHKGFYCIKLKQGGKTQGSNNLNKTYIFKTPNGNIVTVTNLKEFAKINKLSYECMLYVYQGKQPKHKGYVKG